ncbi:hypothetical protein [Haloferula sp.]|uniref:hypothetical protein n=1 Tax=Haloferula sp. TaxID=2497595 RepID=UPI00329B8108
MKLFPSIMASFALLASAASAEESVKVRYAAAIEIRDLEEGKEYLTNRNYVLKKVPKELASMRFTVLPGNEHKDLQATIPKGVTVYLGLDSENKAPDAAAIRRYSAAMEKDGWSYSCKIPVTDKRMKFIRVLKKEFTETTTIDLKGVGFIGSVLISPRIEIKGR